ncbi:MAG: M23 family metallopeptidase [Eubacterium sp.]
MIVFFLIVPLETRWILTGAMALNSKPLEYDIESFRKFELPINEKNDNYKKLALRQIYYEQSQSYEGVPCFFTWQLEKEILEEWEDAYATVLSDLKCFPVGYDGIYGETVSYENSWNMARNYGGNRRHEGVDLMTSNNKPGYFPAVSICDGIIEKMGWLELGGYRLGIRSTHGAYMYYAHLDSYRQGLAIGDPVKAGDIVGYVGNSGYGTEGTKGKFDVHLHFGIYVDIDGKEVSINPYYILKWLEQ